MSMDADPNTYPILILPASNTFYFAITHSLITVNPTMLNPSSIIHHPSVMIHTFPSLYSLYYFTILAIFPIALAPFLSVLPLLAIVPAF